MKKVIIQFCTFGFIFLGIWFLLAQVDYIRIFQIKEKATQLEESLGNFYMDIITQSNKEIRKKEISEPIRKIKDRICEDNGIDAESIQLHVIQSGEVNAFALPGRHIVVNSELILFCQNAEEVAGVLSHEIAHIQKNHIMMKLSKEIGFSALTAMLSSGNGGVESLRILTSTAYDRQIEDQADETGVEYMQNSQINPAPLADFMYRLSAEESALQKQLTFISTHPETEERAKKILDLQQKKQIEYLPVLSDSIWKQLQKEIKEIRN
ncbi:MAG: M48 family metallopeptidase [Dysgonamonadaceae bacterium]|jgi:predicted Zn-dependent protease|nr:M48 family metallopeptidase [Dysgonamonadaceae bacterium]